MSAALKPIPTLLELLGVSWPLTAPAIDVAWDADDATLACAQDEGLLWLADGLWAKGPTLGARPGGAAVVAAETPADQPRRVRAHPGACRVLRAARSAPGRLFSGGDDGRLVRITAAGHCEQLLLRAGHAVHALASGADGVRAWASGAQVYRLHAAYGDNIAMPAAVAALAFDPEGRCLAVAHGDGISLWSTDEPRRLPGDEPAEALAWSADGRHIGCITRAGALRVWRASDGQALPLIEHEAGLRCLAFGALSRLLLNHAW